MWTFRTLKKAGIKLRPEFFNDLPGVVSKTYSDKALESAIRDVKAEVWHYQGEAGKQITDFMLETVNT